MNSRTHHIIILSDQHFTMLTYNAFSVLDPVGVEGHRQEHILLFWDWAVEYLSIVHLIRYLDLAGTQSQASGATFSQFC